MGQSGTDGMVDTAQIGKGWKVRSGDEDIPF
jgi:hypothetical protein